MEIDHLNIHFDFLSLYQVGVSVSAGFVSVIWFEGYKWFLRRRETSY